MSRLQDVRADLLNRWVENGKKPLILNGFEEYLCSLWKEYFSLSERCIKYPPHLGELVMKYTNGIYDKDISYTKLPDDPELEREVQGLEMDVAAMKRHLEAKGE